ncbi:MAG: histidine phosphatase family protein [Candidatus Woesearchaeota archaeon]
MLRLFLVRHGETEENVKGVIQGHLQFHKKGLLEHN